MIGVLDSGVGGLSIYRAIKSRFPEAAIVYMADKANFPYGEKTDKELVNIVRTAMRTLVKFGANVVVVACNSATVSTIQTMRSEFDIPIIGIEPAVKLAANGTKNHRIGILATKRTMDSHDSDKLAPESTLYRGHCESLVSKVENDYAGIDDEDLVVAISPFLKENCDSIVLGCTHYHFVKSRFERLFPEIGFYAPDEAVVNRFEAVLADKKIELTPGNDIFLCSAGCAKFTASLNNLLGIHDADIRKV